MANAIEGLKLTFTGDEIRALLQQRIDSHLRHAEQWEHAPGRGPEEKAEDTPVPDRLCEYEAGRHRWRAEVLTMLREHVQPSALYLLGESDLDFGELLPEKSAALEQEEFDELLDAYGVGRTGRPVPLCGR